jgi:hypothetical protein
MNRKYYRTLAKSHHTWLCCASELDTYSAGSSPSVFWVAGVGLKIGKRISTERIKYKL